MLGRDQTVAGLIRKLQELVETMPEVAGYTVVLESMCGESADWQGTTFRYDETRSLELEAS